MALIDKASLLMVPSTYEAGKLYNVLPSGNRAPDSTGENSGYDQTRADFDFDRGSNAAATRVNADGLIEKYRENLLLQSNQFDTTWSANVGASVTSGQEGYDGTNNAWLLSTTQAGSQLVQSKSASGVHTLSVYAKAGTYDFCRVLMLSANTAYTDFDLANGTIGTSDADTIDATITSVGGGWYRLTLTASDSAITAVRLYAIVADNDITGTSGTIYIQNAQLETGMVSTDYLDSTSVTGKAGVLIDLPRIDYSSGAGALLLEPQRANSLQQSEYFDGGTWIYNQSTITANAATSPEGVVNAYNFVPNTTNTPLHRIYAGNYLLGTSTYSIFIKPNGHNYWALRESQTTGAAIGFDFTDNSIITEYSTGGCTASNGKIEPLENGWYRISGTFAFASATNQAFGLYAAAPTWTSGSVESIAWAGDGISGGYIWGAQVEAGSYATSYIPNHSGTGGVTRAADSCSVTGASNAIGQSEGTIFVDLADSNYQSGGNDLWIIQTALNDTSTAVLIYYTPNSVLAYINNGTSSVSLSTPFTLGQRNKIAVAYKNGDYALYLNGTQADTDSSAIAPPSGMNQVSFCKWLGNQNPQMESVQQAALFNERLTNEELATLTTL